MLEYFEALRAAIDIINGALTAKSHVKTDATVFDELITPMYNHLSKVVTDYLAMFSGLRLSLNDASSKSDVKKSLRSFGEKRLVYLTLRRELGNYCQLASENDDLKAFHKFFFRVRLLLSPEPDSPTAYVAHLSFQMLKDDARQCDFNELISIITNFERWTEREWIATTKEYARLNMRYKVRRLK
jgi:hypothetical protein